MLSTFWRVVATKTVSFGHAGSHLGWEVFYLTDYKGYTSCHCTVTIYTVLYSITYNFRCGLFRVNRRALFR